MTRTRTRTWDRWREGEGTSGAVRVGRRGPREVWGCNAHGYMVGGDEEEGLASGDVCSQQTRAHGPNGYGWVARRWREVGGR